MVSLIKEAAHWIVPFVYELNTHPKWVVLMAQRHHIAFTTLTKVAAACVSPQEQLKPGFQDVLTI